ncbi:MAG TPA: AAA family ATPase [Gemmatimonadales bacterium]|nr:AAA family ATPase [Gemmatimonadales bacterium]
MPGVTLTLLGPPTLSSGGVPVVPQPGSKALALLAFLVLEPHAHSRETLAALLWGESPEHEARASLRQALKQLRTGLGELVQGDRRMIELTEPVGCDADLFRSGVVQEPHLAAVMDVPRFLEGFSVRNAPRFDEWVAETRSALLLQYTTALGILAGEAMGQWRWREAVEMADRWLACDPLSDEAARLAVESRYLAGNRGAALARYAEFRALLLKETGCEPSRGLLTLVRRVEADSTPVPTPQPVTDERYARAPAFSTNLIGRSREWKTLEHCWREVTRGQGRIVLLEGEAGVGKSRLADEFVRHAVAQGAIALRGRGYDATAAIPFAPVVEALRGALAAPGLAGAAPEWLAEAARLLPELRQRFSRLPPAEISAGPQEAWRVFEGAAQVLSSVAAEQPIVVTIDDLHWCDEDSANLLRFLIRRLDQAPVLWLATVTLGEMERDAPAARLTRVLRAKSHAMSIPLTCLDEEGVWQLIHELGHLSTPTAGRRFARRVYGITGGNPFYILELLRTMFDQGLLATDDETPEWTAPAGALESGATFPLSRTVQEVIAERVDRLPEDLAEVLITVSVSGGAGCRPEVLSHVHGISRLHAASACDALVDRRLVVEDGGAYRAAHPVIAHVVRDGLTAPRRREVHRSLALSLEQSLPQELVTQVAGEIARHADRGGERGLAFRAALLACEAALERIAFAEALSWLDLAAASATDEEQRADVNRRTADLLETAGWTEVPAGTPRGIPATREIASDDLDLPMRK